MKTEDSKELTPIRVFQESKEFGVEVEFLDGSKVVIGDFGEKYVFTEQELKTFIRKKEREAASNAYFDGIQRSRKGDKLTTEEYLNENYPLTQIINIQNNSK